MAYTKRRYSAFTIAELIIAIVIFSILSTIAFVAFQNYSVDARNSTREYTTSDLKKGLEIFYAKSSIYPEPDLRISYSWWINTKIHQGIIWTGVISNIRLSSIPKDPSTNDSYVYSTLNDGKSYQIASPMGDWLDNDLFLIQSDIDGNTPYKLDGRFFSTPLLPSLIPIAWTTSFTGGVYNPNTCFFIGDSMNLPGSSSLSCVKKSEMSLEKYNTGLLGYWDMETLSGGLLLDMSWNGNNGVLKWGAVVGSWTGLMGNATYAKSNAATSESISISLSRSGSLVSQYENTISFNIKYLSGTCSYCVFIGSNNNTWNSTMNGYVFQRDGTTNKWYMRIDTNGKNNQKSENIVVFDGKWHNVIITTSLGMINTYLDGKLISGKNFDAGNGFTLTDPMVYFFSPWGGISLESAMDEVMMYNRVLSDEEIHQNAMLMWF